MQLMKINNNLPVGATKLIEDDLFGLIPAYVCTRNDLNEFEKMNIVQALSWLRKKKFSYVDILDISILLKVHHKMFDKTWAWAGKFRSYEVNIGNVPPEQVPTKIKLLLGDVVYWVEGKIYSVDEICARFHHAITWIRPFPNGNGRISRILSDELSVALGHKVFDWGNLDGNSATNSIQNRQHYIDTLRLADKKNYQALIHFMRKI